MWFAKVFPPNVHFAFFNLLSGSSEELKFLIFNFNKVNFSVFLDHAFGQVEKLFT